MNIYDDLVSKRIREVPPSGIRRFFDLILGMEDVVSLGVGEPDFVTPWHIREKTIYSLEEGYTTYTSNSGMMELREEVAGYLHTRWGLRYNPSDEILITVGVSEALDLALRAILNPEDEVIIPEPCYVSYSPCVLFAGGVPVMVRTLPQDGFEVKANAIERALTERTKAILLCYPNNPTGATIPYDELLGIARAIKDYKVIVITDEIYGELIYEGTHVPFASLEGMRDRTILLNGFSKAYAMTGFRIGYAASSKPLIQAMAKIHQYTILCASISAQVASIEALRSGNNHKEEMLREYAKRRRLIVEGLNRIGLRCPSPKGAFYVFPSIEGMGMNEEEFSERLLLEEKVAVVPGTAFGPSGKGHIRCSYATSIENIEEALTRMERFVRRIRG